MCSTQSINKKPTSNTKKLVITKLGPHDKIDSDRKSPPSTQRTFVLPDSDINITKAQSSDKQPKPIASTNSNIVNNVSSKEVLKTFETKTMYIGDDKSTKCGKDYDKTKKWGTGSYKIRQHFGSKERLNIEPISNSTDNDRSVGKENICAKTSKITPRLAVT